jgi:2-dehydro-3-deoxy-D-arabinonate dehydratase
VLIERGGQPVVDDTTTLDKMKRTFDELAGWLGRDNSFPTGVILLTGTGIVPPDEFSLEAGDMVKISISGIGTLATPVVRG